MDLTEATLEEFEDRAEAWVTAAHETNLEGFPGISSTGQVRLFGLLVREVSKLKNTEYEGL